MSFAIGLENTKFDVNVGTVLRSAFNFGASLVFTVGRRYTRQCSDTTAASRHVPTLHFATWDEAWAHLPYGWMPVGVELVDGAELLPTFPHPKSAVYLFGPEDGGLSKAVQGRCAAVIRVPCNRCLNLAVCAAVVMYDRTRNAVLAGLEKGASDGT